MSKKYPEDHQEIMDKENIDLKHGYSGYPEEHYEIMESSKENKK